MQTPREAGGAEGQRALRGGAERTGAPGAWEAARAREKVLSRSVWGWLAWGGPWDFLTPLRNLGVGGGGGPGPGTLVTPLHVPPPRFRAAAQRPQLLGLARGRCGRKRGGLGRPPLPSPPLPCDPRPRVPRHLPSSWSNTMVPRPLQPARAEDAEGARLGVRLPRLLCSGPAGSAPRELQPRTEAGGGGRGRAGAGSWAPRTRSAGGWGRAG